MSDRHLNAQHAEVRERNRLQRLATMAEAQRLADLRASGVFHTAEQAPAAAVAVADDGDEM